MKPPSDRVQEIRQEIDSMDRQVHDLLMRRAELVLEIGEEKRKHNIQVVQPDREAVMIRKLLARHEGPLPREAVVRIWRELVGAVSLLQTGLKVAVTVPHDEKGTGLEYWDMAKDYFSSVLPMQRMNDALSTLAAVRDGQVTFGVVPWPEEEDKRPWWYYLLGDEGEKPMRIAARLPFGDRTMENLRPEHKALVVARLRFEPSDDDCSFLAIELKPEISRGRVVDEARRVGMDPLGLCSYQDPRDEKAWHLLEVRGYYRADDKAVKEVLQELAPEIGRCVCLGGYPVPPVYEDKVGKGAEARNRISKAG